MSHFTTSSVPVNDRGSGTAPTERSPQYSLAEQTRRKRYQVLHASEMYADAVRIGIMTLKLKEAMDEFAELYDRDFCAQLFERAGCGVPSDQTEEGWDTTRLWSEWVYDDIQGIQWTLTMFISSLEGYVGGLDDQNFGKRPDAQAGEGETDDELQSPAIVGELSRLLDLNERGA